MTSKEIGGRFLLSTSNSHPQVVDINIDVNAGWDRPQKKFATQVVCPKLASDIPQYL